MKRIILLIVAATAIAIGGVGAAFAASADKPPSPPGQGPCEHGNSGKPCKDDPQPDRGKDCEEHGKKGGVNEDHCKGGTTPDPTTPEETTTSTETTTPEPPTTTPSDTGGEPPVTETDTTTTSETPGPAPTSADSLEQELEQQAKANGATSAPPVSRPQAAGELPYTGLPLWAIALIGAGITGAGLALRRR